MYEFQNESVIATKPYNSNNSKENQLKIQIFEKATTKLKLNALRIGAGIKSDKITDLEYKTVLKVLGKIQQWYHIKANNSLQGLSTCSYLEQTKSTSQRFR